MKKVVCILSIFIGLGMFNVCFAEKNPACTSGSKILILQVLDEGALGFICPRVNWSYSNYETACKLDGRLVYLTPNNNYVDEQIVKIKRNECFAEIGTYRYMNKKDDIKTVRAIEIINKLYK